MIWLWLAGLSLFATGIFGVWWTVTKTGYLPRLAVWLIKQVIAEAMKQKDPKLLALWHEAVRQGLEWDHAKNKPKEPR